MKRAILLLGLFALTTAVLSAQIPPNWDTNPPRDTAAVKYAVGISQPSATEQDAMKNAWQNAVQQFASSIATRFQGQTDITVQSESFSSGIEDAYTVIMETSSFSTNVPITGVSELARKIETPGGRYVARVLTSMSIEDYNRARQYVENEEAAFLAYRFFEQRNTGLPRLDMRSKPQSYPDYYTWLRNDCVILSVITDNQTPYLEQIDLFAKKLYRNSLVFPQRINDRSVRIIYDSSRYYAGILRALENSNAFSVSRESYQLLLTPAGSSALSDFRNIVANMKDSSKIFIIGNELIQTNNSMYVNTGNLFANEFRNIASRGYGLSSVSFNIPSSFLNTVNFNPDGIIDHIKGNLASFPARFAAICSIETVIEPGIAQYNIPPLITASGTFILYDVITGETFHSDTVSTAGFVFSPSNLNDQTVINESRRAIQFLFDPKNQPGLKGIMDRILTQL